MPLVVCGDGISIPIIIGYPRRTGTRPPTPLHSAPVPTKLIQQSFIDLGFVYFTYCVYFENAL